MKCLNILFTIEKENKNIPITCDDLYCFQYLCIKDTKCNNCNMTYKKIKENIDERCLI